MEIVTKEFFVQCQIKRQPHCKSGEWCNVGGSPFHSLVNAQERLNRLMEDFKVSKCVNDYNYKIFYRETKIKEFIISSV